MMTSSLTSTVSTTIWEITATPPNANTNVGSSLTPHVSLFLLIEFVLQFLVLAIGLDMLDMSFKTCKNGQFDFHVFSHILFNTFMD
jgi:hypothetical protein